MPFSKTTEERTEQHWSEVFNDVFRPAFENCGYKCERAKPMTGGLLESIVESLSQSNIVLADITDRNSNVFYELGIRHSIKKGTIIVSQGGMVPSDLGGQWYLQYGLNPAQVRTFKDEIKRLLNEIETKPDKADSPVSVYLERENRMVSSVIQRENVKKLAALHTELTRNIHVFERLMTSSISHAWLRSSCLELLCDTMYVDIGPFWFEKAHRVSRNIESSKLYLDMSYALQQYLTEAKELSEFILHVRQQLSAGAFMEPALPTTLAYDSSGAIHRID